MHAMAISNDVILAFGQNKRVLHPDHGYVRIILRFHPIDSNILPMVAPQGYYSGWSRHLSYRELSDDEHRVMSADIRLNG